MNAVVAVPRAVGNKILVEAEPTPEASEGGIIFADISKTRSERGTVVSVGDGQPDGQGGRTPPVVAVGDCVVFAAHAGYEVKTSSGTYLVMREDDILCVLE